MDFFWCYYPIIWWIPLHHAISPETPSMQLMIQRFVLQWFFKYFLEKSSLDQKNTKQSPKPTPSTASQFGFRCIWPAIRWARAELAVRPSSFTEFFRERLNSPVDPDLLCKIGIRTLGYMQSRGYCCLQALSPNLGTSICQAGASVPLCSFTKQLFVSETNFQNSCSMVATTVSWMQAELPSMNTI